MRTSSCVFLNPSPLIRLEQFLLLAPGLRGAGAYVKLGTYSSPSSELSCSSCGLRILRRKLEVDIFSWSPDLSDCDGYIGRRCEVMFDMVESEALMQMY